jgi:hypothetical protein
MSKTFLRTLAGRKPNALNHWLDAHRGSPRIAWYPSAGGDLRDLLFLSERYRRVRAARYPEPAQPDIYLHTDYLVGEDHFFNPFRLDHPVLVNHAPLTTIRVIHHEMLPPQHLAFHQDLVAFQPGLNYGMVCFMVLCIESDSMGCWTVPLVYAAVENAAMGAHMLDRKAKVSHIVQLCFGHGMGGGLIGPGFLTRLVVPLRTESFITDRRFADECDQPVPHFNQLNEHPPVDLNTWKVARLRWTVPWHGYEPSKFFVRPQQRGVGHGDKTPLCRQCRLGDAVIERHREAVNAGSPLPPCDPRVAVKHHHQHRITVRTMDGWSYQYHINAGSVRVDRFCMGREGRARYEAFHQLHGDEQHRFGGLQGTGTRSIYGHTNNGAEANPAQYNLIAREALQIMQDLNSLGRVDPMNGQPAEAVHAN